MDIEKMIKKYTDEKLISFDMDLEHIERVFTNKKHYKKTTKKGGNAWHVLQAEVAAAVVAAAILPHLMVLDIGETTAAAVVQLLEQR